MRRRASALLRVPLLAAGGLAAWGLAACAGDEGDTVAPSPPDDEWGGEVVVVPGEDLEAAPTLELVEEVRIGSLDGPPETQHVFVSDVDLHGDEIFVVDSRDAEVRVYGRDGAYRRTIGGRGEGPGEFQSPSRIQVADDTVVVVERQRVTWFDAEGTVLDTRTEGFFATDRGESRGIGVAGPTWIRFRHRSFREGVPRDVLLRDTVHLHLGEPGETDFGPEIFAHMDTPRMSSGELGFWLRPFYVANPEVAWDPAGRLYYSPGDEYRIDIVEAATGDPVRRITSTLELAPVTDDMVDRAWAAEEARLQDARPGSEAEMYAEVAARRLDLPVPEVRPVVGTLRPATDGGLLVQRLDLDADPLESGDPGHWDVYAPDGTFRGRFVTAPGARVVRYDEGRVVIVEQDDLDVQHVVVYRLDGG